MHCSNGGEGTDYTSNGDIVVDTFDDYLGEPCLVPCAQNEVSNKLILGCDPLGVSTGLSQSGCACVRMQVKLSSSQILQSQNTLQNSANN